MVCLAGFLGSYPGPQVTEHVSLNFLRFLSPQLAGFNSPLSGFLSGGQYRAASRNKRDSWDISWSLFLSMKIVECRSEMKTAVDILHSPLSKRSRTKSFLRILARKSTKRRRAGMGRPNIPCFVDLLGLALICTQPERGKSSSYGNAC